jgi:hypothetical protein
MSELGSIFEDADGDEPRGPDLRVAVEVPRRALGRADGWVAPVPDAIDDVPRVKTPGDPPGALRLHLPETFTSGAVLRLRGQGGAVEGGLPGDLYLQIEVVEAPPGPSRLRGTIVVFVVAALGAAAVWAFAS